MDFNKFKVRLTEVQQRIETELSSVLPDPDGHQAVIMEAMRYATLGGGKRVRPFLLVETAQMFNADLSAVWPAACALECIHAYSLVHDDLPCMDDDDLRRGKPTVHKAFNEAIAVLTGDALLTHAFEILANIDAPAVVRIELVRELTRASGAFGMIGGQVIDIQADENARNSDIITELQRLKTGALIKSSVIMGAKIGNATERQLSSLASYADDLGLIFQITDDILDVEGKADRVGKAVGKDENHGKATFVSILGLESAKQKARELAGTAKGRLEPFGEKAQMLSETVDYILVRDQ